MDGGARGEIVSIELESADPPAHEHAHGAGAHAAAVLRIREARARGAAVSVQTSVTRSNVHALAALGAMLADEQVGAWTLALADAPTDATAQRILPPIGLTAPRVLHALAAARARGIEPFVVGFPLCVLGPYAGWSVPLPDRPGAHAAPCDGCAARSGCPGLSSIHRQRFGVTELRPLTAPIVAERSDARDALVPSSAGPKTSVD